LLVEADRRLDEPQFFGWVLTRGRENSGFGLLMLESKRTTAYGANNKIKPDIGSLVGQKLI